jgi:hypothetical protein
MESSLPAIPTVRIDDLAEPTYSVSASGQRQQLAALVDMVPFDAEGLWALASGEVGWTKLSDEGCLARVDTLLRCFAATPLSAAGRVALAGQLLQFLKGRLLVERELDRHPEIEDLVLEPPIIIVGLPRTGTTHLHNLMAADPGLRFLPYFEAVEPVLADHERGLGFDPRLERTETTLQLLNDALPLFKRMHHMTTWHAHEEINLLALDFSSMLYETQVLSEELREWYKGRDQTPHYEFLRTVMKVLQFLRPGPARWVLKSPQHLEQLPVLRSVFPGATVVVTARDPLAVTASLCTMQGYLLRMSYDHLDLRELGRYWSSRIEDLLMGCLADRDTLDPAHSIDVRFSDYMADQLGTLERIYDLAGQPVTERARRGWQTYLADHPRDRFGKVVQELEPFGIDPDERRRTFAPYTTRFALEDG